MTTGATTDFELSRDTLIRRAMQAAQLLDADGQPQAGYIAMAADFLNMEMQALASDGVTLYQKARMTQALVAGTAGYALGSSTIDVVVGPDNFAGTIVDSNNLETRVTAMPGHEYVLLADKTVQSSRPTHVYIEKASESIQLLFWPVPSATATFRYQRIKLPQDATPGSATMDAPRRWQKYLWLQMAYLLARSSSKPLDLVRDLRSDAKEAKKAALLSDRETMGGQFYVAPYSGGC